MLIYNYMFLDRCFNSQGWVLVSMFIYCLLFVCQLACPGMPGHGGAPGRKNLQRNGACPGTLKLKMNIFYCFFTGIFY